MNDLIDFFVFKLFPIFLTIPFVFISFVFKKLYKNWINPASILSIFWFIYTFFPLILAWNVPIDSVALIYLIAANFIFALSSVFFKWDFFDLKKYKKFSIKENFLFNFLLAMAIFSMILIFLDLMSQGVVFNGSVVDFGGQLASLRYAEELVENSYSKISNILNYAIPSMGGVLFSVSKDRWRRIFILVIAFLPLTFVLISQSAKGPFLLGCALFLNGILVFKLISGEKKLTDLSELNKSFKYFLPVALLMIFSFVSRGLDISDEDGLNKLYSYLISYSSGHLYAFSDWFQFEFFGNSITFYENSNLTYGFYTFMGFFRLMGDVRVIPIGTYAEIYNYNDLVVTNVYTIFRGLITDFGIIGSLAVVFIAGILVNFCYYLLLCFRRSFFGVFGFSLFFSMCYQSFGISSLQWTSVWVGIALFSVFFKMSLVNNKDKGGLNE